MTPRVTSLVVTLSSALLAAALTGCGTPAPKQVTVTARSFGYEPASLEWHVGQPVRLRLRNPDAVEHDFVVDALKYTSAGDGHAAHGAAAGPTPSPDSLHIHAPAFGEGTLTLTPRSKGTYVVYCTIPGHKEAGMTARLVVG